MDPDLERELKAKDRYAGYYESATKQSKERGVLSDWLDSEFGSDWPYRGFKQLPDDPPDFECLDQNGLTVAIEITEFVDQMSVQRAKAGRYEIRIWDVPNTREHLNRIVSKKTEKMKKRDWAQYGRRILLVHSGEGLLTAKLVREAFPSGRVQSPIFDEVFVIMPPLPKTDGIVTEEFVYEAHQVIRLVRE